MVQINSIEESTTFEVELVYTFQYISKYFFTFSLPLKANSLVS